MDLLRLVIQFIHFLLHVVSVIPGGEAISHVDGNFTLFCVSSDLSVGIISSEWLLNGTTVDSNSRGVTVEFSNDVGVGVLRLSNIATNFNNTQIRCVAVLTSGQVTTSNSATLLLLQGKFSCILIIGPVLFQHT